MPVLSECEFELSLIVYDLLGREATTTKRFVFSPRDNPFATVTTRSFEQINKKISILIISIFTLLVVLVFVVAKCANTTPATPTKKQQQTKSFHRYSTATTTASSSLKTATQVRISSSSSSTTTSTTTNAAEKSCGYFIGSPKKLFLFEEPEKDEEGLRANVVAV